jgi:hypothetical protein
MLGPRRPSFYRSGGQPSAHNLPDGWPCGATCGTGRRYARDRSESVTFSASEEFKIYRDPLYQYAAAKRLNLI